MRTVDRARTLLAQGAHRVIVGTSAFTKTGIDQPLLAALRDAVGRERLTIALDSKGGRIVVKGWQESTAQSVLEIGQRLHSQGIEWCVLTDVSRDGVSNGVNVAGAVELQNATGLNVVASGGASSLEDVRRARKAGLAGVIIGRSLYDGKISLKNVVTALAVQSD